MYKGLHGLPERMMYRGKLYRGQKGVHGDDWSTTMKEGKVFSFDPPTAFSKVPSSIQLFKDTQGPRVCFIIEDWVGYDLKEISKYPEESEVLLEGVPRVRVLSTNDEDKVVGEAGAEYFRVTCAMHCGVPMLQGSPLREKEREIISENLGAIETGQLNKKDFTLAPFAEADWRKRKRLENDDEAYEDEVLDSKTLSLLGQGDQGTFAKTYRMQQVHTGKHVAAKMHKKSKLGASFNVDKFKDEVRLVQALRHRNVIEYVGWYPTLKEFVIVMNYIPDGNLAELMATARGVELGRSVAEQIGRALHYMHHESPQHVVHLDIKPENVLVGAAGPVGVARVLKLADFGLAYVVSTTQGTRIFAGGTPCYMSPEQFYSSSCGTYVDMWALGCVLVEAVSGERLRGPLCKESPEVRERRMELIERTGLASTGLGKVAEGLLFVNKHTRFSAKEMAEVMILNQKQALAAAVAAGHIPLDHPINTPFEVEGLGVQQTGSKERTGLASVASEGDLEGVKLLLEAGASVSAKDVKGWTPLHYAASMDRVECARFLLEVGADREAKAESGGTPLHSAALEGHVRCVRVLLEAGADTEARDKRRSTPLHAAASRDHVECVRVLLAAGAEKESETMGGKTPLYVAVSHGRVECVRVLLKAGADNATTDKNEWTPLHAAVLKGHDECARVLLDAGAKTKAENLVGQTPLHVAASMDHLECARVLLKAGADTRVQDNKWWWTPLHYAASMGYFTCARVLLEAGADKEAITLKRRVFYSFASGPKDRAAANRGYRFSFKGGRRMIPWLDSEEEWGDATEEEWGGRTREKSGGTPLHFAASMDHLECARVLLEAGADKEAKAENGWTPLHYAVSMGHFKCARVLLEAGADKEAKNLVGQTPLYAATSMGHIECVRVLLVAGADLEAGNNKETGTPLHAAAIKGDAKCLSLLLEAGADKEALNEYLLRLSRTTVSSA